ncbi:MAG: class IV adenylate cyclase [Calditrichia bacterium]
MKNIEIKYRVKSIQELQNFLSGADEVKRVWQREQQDIYYNIPNGRLKLRLEDDTDSQLIFYRRDNSDQARESNYFIYRSDKAEDLSNILGMALGRKLIVKKVRTLLMFRNVRIHLDRVEGLGEFLEFESVVNGDTSEQEAQRNLAEIQAFLSGFEFHPVPESYSDLLTDKSGGKKQ